MYILQCLYSLFFFFSFVSLALQNHDNEYLVSSREYEKYKQDTINQLENDICPVTLESPNMENGILIRTNGFVNQPYQISEAYNTYVNSDRKYHITSNRLMKSHEIKRIQVYNKYQTRQLIDPAKVGIDLVNEAFDLYIKLKSGLASYGGNSSEIFRTQNIRGRLNTFLRKCLPLKEPSTLSQLDSLEVRKILNLFLQRCMTFESITTQLSFTETASRMEGYVHNKVINGQIKGRAPPGAWAIYKSSTLIDEPPETSENDRKRTWKVRGILVMSMEGLQSVPLLQAEGYGICVLNYDNLDTSLEGLKKLDIFEPQRLGPCYPNLLSLLESSFADPGDKLVEPNVTIPFFTQ